MQPNRIVVLDPAKDERRTAAIPTAMATARHLYVDEDRRRIWLPLSDGGRLGMLRFTR
jgi:hypothetical protein